jgi:hypothetical protein
MQFVSLSTEDRDLGIVEKSEAKASAQRFADKEGETVTMRDPTSDKVLGKVKPTTKGKAAKTTKAAAKPTRKAKGAVKAAKGTKAAETAKPTNGAPKQPRGMVVEILKLAHRTKGVSPTELNELTKWKGAPWKWLFSNPKKNGYADRFGYKFWITADDENARAVRYHVERK